jgi:hypothetical protein
MNGIGSSIAPTGTLTRGEHPMMDTDSLRTDVHARTPQVMQRLGRPRKWLS